MKKKESKLADGVKYSLIENEQGLWIDFSVYSPNIRREKVVEWTRLPSGRIVAMSEQDSFWFEANGKSPKGSYLTPWEEKH